MRKRCSTCGTPAPDDESVFCNRCGARLPAAAETLTCRQCGNPVTDRQSRFCNRCGSPLGPAARAAAPPARPARGTICRQCGFENFGENLFYCKKCGAIFPRYEPVRQAGPAETIPASRSHDGPIRIVPDGMDELRQKPVNPPDEPWQKPAGARLVRHPAPAAGGTNRKPWRGAPGTWKNKSLRKIAIIAGVILIILVIVFIAVSGLSGTGSPDETSPDSTVPGSTDSGSTDSGLLEALPPGILSGQTPAINQATPVVTDTRLKMR